MIFKPYVNEQINTVVTVNEEFIERTNCSLFLGVELDDQLNWKNKY
jgi:hypothetical protein